MAQSQLDQAIARRLQRDRQNFAPPVAGLDNLPSQGAEQPDTTSRMLDIERVRPNPEQARTEFPRESIAELAASLKRDGQLQPILVRPIRPKIGASTWGESEASEDAPQEFEIVMGERRWRAARSIGLSQIRATVRDIDDAEMLRLSLVENIQREDLNAVDRARTLLQLKQSSPGLTWHDIAADLGLSRQSINNLVALLKLPRDIQDDIRAGHLTEKHARALRQLEGPQQKQLSEQIKAQQISGEAALAQVRGLKGTQPAPQPKSAKPSTKRAASALKLALEQLAQAQDFLPKEAMDAPGKQHFRSQIEVARKYLQELEDALQ
jgi:ParB family chromosome partitioning protein